MKKKILFIPFILLFIISIFALYSSAYNTGDIIPEGSIITFNNTPVSYGSNTNLYTVNISFSNNDTNYNKFLFSNTALYFGSTSQPVYVQRSWNNNKYKVIEVIQDYIIENNNIASYFNTYLSVEEPPPPPPPSPEDTVLNEGQNFLDNSLSNITTIINFITGNTVIALFTIGIFLISITVGILYRLNNKTTRKKS